MRNLLIQNTHRKIICHLLIKRVIIFLVLQEYLNRHTNKTCGSAGSTDATEETFTYDASGKPLTVTDFYGRTIKHEYDTAGNKTKMTTPESNVITYSYDSGNRLINLNTTIAGVAAGFSLRYDSMGRRTSLTYPNGVTTTYSYDTTGNLTNLLTQYAELKEHGKKKPPIDSLRSLQEQRKMGRFYFIDNRTNYDKLYPCQEQQG